MNKTVKGILVALAVLAVILLAFFAGTKKPVKVITEEKYGEIASSNGYVYYGDVKNTDALEKLASDANIVVNFVDSSKTKLEGLKENTLYNYEKGKEVFKYSGELSGYSFTKALMSEGIIKNDYITISVDEYKDIIKSDGYNFMFIGSATCGWCDRFKTSIAEALEKHDFNVYYIDLSTLTEEEYKELSATDSYFTEEQWGTPLNFLYKDGKRVDVLSGYVPSDELIKFLEKNKVI